MRQAVLQIRTEEPDYLDVQDLEHDWSRSVYGEITKVIPQNAPEPLGKYVTTTHYVDANLMQDLVTGRSVTATLYSGKQDSFGLVFQEASSCGNSHI
jgi:hypothetical protein